MKSFHFAWVAAVVFVCTVMLGASIQDYIDNKLFELRLQQEHNQLVLLEALRALHGELAEAKRDREELEAMLQLSLSGGP